MKRLFEKLTNALAAVAFAEEGEADTARELLAEAGPDEPRDREEEAPLLHPRRHPPLAKSS